MLRVINHREAITHQQALSVLLSYHRWGIKLQSVLQNRNYTCDFALIKHFNPPASRDPVP